MNGFLTARFTKRFPGGSVIRVRLELPVDGFSTTVLFGPSGCGKTTVLRSLAGLERPDEGTIHFGDEVWFDAARSVCCSPQERGIGFGFQDYALFPHLTVRENVGYGLSRSDVQRERTVREMLERFQLDGLDDRYPHQISGGQQQRVSLARVLVRRTRLLLLDEPLSALDATLRDELRFRLRPLLRDFNIPVVLVTHDRREAMALADRVVVMDRGEVEQDGRMEEVFSRPANPNVARIVGVETIETGHVIEIVDGLATVDVRGVRLLAVALSDHRPGDAGRRVHVCIRGEDVTLQTGDHGPQSTRNHFAGTVRTITPEGPLLRVGIDCGFDLTALVTRPASEELGLRIGDTVTASLKASAIHLIG